MRSLTSKMAGSSQQHSDLLPRSAHSAGKRDAEKRSLSWICSKAPTGGSFDTSWSCAPPFGTTKHTNALRSGPTPGSTFKTPVSAFTITCERFYRVFMGEPTLYIIDDCSATKALTKKKDMLSELAFSGRHADQSVWVLTQKYNFVLKDLREQTRWVCLFHCKDRDSFEDCLSENDVIPTREQRASVRQQLAETKHAKLLLKTDQPAAYMVLSNC